ncbi:hypothetical protein GGI22_000947 [Coemansia erecta]|nr:hypothetical protein GGI22_000947 [Coemansia erecta]
MCDTLHNTSRYRFIPDTQQPFGVFRLYNFCCNICGAVFDNVYAADDHVKENHFFPPL